MERGVYFRLKGDPDSSQAKTKVSMKAEGWPHETLRHPSAARWLPAWQPIMARCHEGERHELLPSWENLPRHRAACCDMAWEFRKIIPSRLVRPRVPRRRMSSSTKVGVGVVPHVSQNVSGSYNSMSLMSSGIFIFYLNWLRYVSFRC